MISVLTLTYQRHNFLEEAIYSFLHQSRLDNAEMVIINDSPVVEYRINAPNIKIINLNKRFSSIGKKLEFGFTQCNGEYIYRLDDDDLLAPWALELQEEYKKLSPDNDIYRCESHYLFVNNKYDKLVGSVNNGNCYSINYIKKIGNFVDRSGDEDYWLTFSNSANIYTGNMGKFSMIYRWGMNTYHISSMRDYENNEFILGKTDEITKTENGIIYLSPKFKEDYWSQLPI
jgi:hypothetical protein